MKNIEIREPIKVFFCFLNIISYLWNQVDSGGTAIFETLLASRIYKLYTHTNRSIEETEVTFTNRIN